VEALTKEKKEKENVLTYLELMNLQDAFLLNVEEFRERITKGKKKSWWRQIRSTRGICNNYKQSWRLEMNKGRVWTQLM
jgi:hypothetical protein